MIPFEQEVFGEFRIDGNTSDLYEHGDEKYLSWSVYHGDTFICTMFGPMSRRAAQFAAYGLNEEAAFNTRIYGL